MLGLRQQQGQLHHQFTWQHDCRGHSHISSQKWGHLLGPARRPSMLRLHSSLALHPTSSHHQCSSSTAHNPAFRHAGMRASSTGPMTSPCVFCQPSVRRSHSRCGTSQPHQHPMLHQTRKSPLCQSSMLTVVGHSTIRQHCPSRSTGCITCASPGPFSTAPQSHASSQPATSQLSAAPPKRRHDVSCCFRRGEDAREAALHVGEVGGES